MGKKKRMFGVVQVVDGAIRLASESETVLRFDQVKIKNPRKFLGKTIFLVEFIQQLQ